MLTQQGAFLCLASCVIQGYCSDVVGSEVTSALEALYSLVRLAEFITSSKAKKELELDVFVPYRT